MNILGRDIQFRRKPGAQGSRIASVLPRIRAIRDQCDWEPLTSPSAAQQRGGRVRDARRTVAYRSLPCERDLQFRLPAKLGVWRRVIGVAGGLFIVVLVWAAAMTDWGGRNANYVYRYKLPAAPQFLSEDVALTWAKQSLSGVVDEVAKWKPVTHSGNKASFAPNGIRDTYLSRDNRTNANQGVLLFESDRITNESWLVTVVLNSNQLECTVSRRR